MALAAHGDEALPLLKRLLKDEHHGVRAGALATLTHIFKSENEEYRSEVPENLAEIIKLIRPMITDDSPLVRQAASTFVTSMKVLNDDIYEILGDLARQGGNAIAGVVRYGIKDPRVRTKLCMALVDAANRCRSKVPGEYIPMILATTAHLELCESYLQTAIDTLNNPAVLTMYGFFSNHPPNGALQILERYARHPLVLAHLPDILRFAVRKRGGVDSYWYPIVEFPHRIVVKVGPEALPVLEAFCASEEALYRRIQTGAAERPAWWKEDTLEQFDIWRREMEVTAELVLCLHGRTPTAEAIPSVCSIYLSNRPWGEWERQQIRDLITELGVEVLPRVRREVAGRASSLLADLDRQITATQARVESDRQKKRAIQKEIDAIQGRRAALNERVRELEELVSLIEVCHARRPSPADVRTLCRFYVERPWGNRYPFVTANTSYMRPLYERQLVLVRDTMVRWGRTALPALNSFLEEDAQTLAEVLTELDKEEEFWKPQWSRKSTVPLARIAQEREDVRRIREELRDLADLIECASQDRLSRGQIGVLCRIYTRREWPAQEALIRDLLRRAGAGATPVIMEHVRSEKDALPTVVEQVHRYMSNTAKDRIKWRYDRARAVERSVRRGIEGLGTIVRAQE